MIVNALRIMMVNIFQFFLKLVRRKLKSFNKSGIRTAVRQQKTFIDEIE